ncbi:MAG: magnesium transporter [Erysipelotrichaceae bacterium]
MNFENNLKSLKQFLLTSDDALFNENIEYVHPVDILDIIHDEEDEDVQTQILNRLPNETLALLIDFEEDEEKYELLQRFNTRKQSTILNEMSSDEIVSLVDILEDDEKAEIFDKMKKADREEISQLLSYKEDTAGSIMATEFISIRENKTILSTLEYLQKVAEDADMTYYLYVIDKPGHLTGVVSTRDIITSSFETKISDITNRHVMSVHVDDDQEEVARLFDKYDYIMLPVVDDDNLIVGVITIDDIVDIIKEETTEDIHRMAGLDEEEKVDGNIIDSIKSRLPWLCVNLVTAFVASSVVNSFSDTIQSVVALAAINPIIAGMGGNAGTQSVTIIVRGIALNEVNSDNMIQIFIKEFSVGLFNGICIGSVLSICCYLFFGSPILGFIAGASIICNLIIATCFGYMVPMILTKLKIDPALASSVFVTTATDAFGFFVFLGLATLFLPYLI